MATGLEKALAGAVRWIEDQLLVDTVRIRRPSLADPVFNDTTGQLAGDLFLDCTGHQSDRPS